MINRGNMSLINKYLAERSEKVVAEIICAETVDLTRIHLLLLAKFVNETKFVDLPKKFNGDSFNTFLATQQARRDNKNKPLAARYKRKVVSDARNFFLWLQCQPGFQKAISQKWINTFEFSKRGQQEMNAINNSNARKYFTLEEIYTIAKTPAITIQEKRIRCAIVFLYLSAARISAFLTLPVKAVDVIKRTIDQDPDLGVHTKLGHCATTTLLNIKELLDIVIEWDQQVQKLNDQSMLWFAPISSKTGLIDPSVPIGKYRDAGFRKDMERFLTKAGIQYRGPHQLRHGHIRYMRDHSKNDIKSLEAIATNCLQTTATMLKYGILTGSDARIAFDNILTNSSEKEEISNVLRDDDNFKSMMTELLAQQRKDLTQHIENLMEKQAKKEEK